MELLKKDIHTERIKAKSLLQVPLEEDVNVSDAKPDVARVIYSSGRVKTDEIKVGMNKIWVKGRLEFQVMYRAEGAGEGISGMEGELPFMEEIFLDKSGSRDSQDSQDRVICRTRLDDLRVQIINSRKLSIQAVISLEPRVEETVSEEICIGLEGLEEGGLESGIEYRKKQLDYLETVVKKRDLLRIHEEAKLPAGMPDMGGAIWKSMDVSQISFRAADEKLEVGGELNVFVVYREDNTDKINWYEAAVPFTGSVECQNSREGMLADVSYDIGHEEISIRDNSDGEARLIGVEAALELEMKLYEKQQAQVIADVYGVSCEVSAVTDNRRFCNLLAELNVEEKLSRNIRLEDTENKVLQICHCDAHPVIEDVAFEQNQVRITGGVELRLLYSSNAEEPAIYPIHESIPFEITRELENAADMDIEQYAVSAQLTRQTVSIQDSAQLEWRGLLNLRLLVYEGRNEAILTDLKLSPIPDEVLEGLPGFAIYRVAGGDSLWQIGKKYYVSVERIREINGLTDDAVKTGDKLLILR
ncbi:MAG: DUF3794 domain-containing protein [Lachnospiraceae bacterium]|nr:DUF3794 domain-containing protein [Lachnospiraceae bacterium]